jgi:hypothetical protein
VSLPCGRYECLRGALGAYRRTALGSDRNGREYFVLGEQWSALFVCEPPVVDETSADTALAIVQDDTADLGKGWLSAPDAKAASDEEAAYEGAGEGDVGGDGFTDEDATEDEDGDATDEEVMDGGDALPGGGSARKHFAKMRAEASCTRAKAVVEGAAKPPPRVVKASGLENSTWAVVTSAGELRALLTSLVASPAYCDEARLRSALVHLEPKFTAAMALGLASPSEGLLGAICSQCYAQTEEVLLCDGAAGQACPEEWCFKCAGVAELPEGDWKCAACARCHEPRNESAALCNS